LFVWHGFPGSARQGGLFQEIAEQQRVRVFSLDRPGYGQTSPAPQSNPRVALSDLLFVADQFGISSFHLVGISGGAPYARALASGHPARVQSLTTLGGLGSLRHGALQGLSSFERWGLQLAKTLPSWTLSRVLKQVVDASRLESFLQRLILTLPPADQLVLQDERVRTELLQSFHEALQGGVEGLVTDLKGFWGLSHEADLQVQTPWRIWHGQEDSVVSLTAGKAGVPSQVWEIAQILPKHGHYSVPISLGPAILAQILGT